MLANGELVADLSFTWAQEPTGPEVSQDREKQILFPTKVPSQQTSVFDVFLLVFQSLNMYW